MPLNKFPFNFIYCTNVESFEFLYSTVVFKQDQCILDIAFISSASSNKRLEFDLILIFILHSNCKRYCKLDFLE